MATLTLASMNLHAGRRADGSPFDVGAVCDRLRADIIALQEAWREEGQQDGLARAADRIGARLLRANLLAGRDLRTMRISPDRARGTWGLALLTTAPVLRYDVLRLGRARGDVAVRAAQVITVALPGGGALRVVNTHLTHRFTSPAQLVRLVLRLAASGSDVPTVIAGDLNMPAPVTGLAAGYSPAVTGKTFPAHRPVVQLDHILAGRGVRSGAGEVLPPLGSDHLPVRATLQVN